MAIVVKANRQYLGKTNYHPEGAPDRLMCGRSGRQHGLDLNSHRGKVRDTCYVCTHLILNTDIWVLSRKTVKQAAYGELCDFVRSRQFILGVGR